MAESGAANFPHSIVFVLHIAIQKVPRACELMSPDRRRRPQARTLTVESVLMARSPRSSALFVVDAGRFVMCAFVAKATSSLLPQPAFSLRTEPPPRTSHGADRAEKVRRHSRHRYGRPRALVEAEIARALA
jgi:hypothetical protein